MCFSAESSIIAWMISVIIACYLWYRNRNHDRWNAGFIITFSLVQLWEAGIWSGKNPSIMLQLILVSLFAQPLIQTYGASTSYPNSKVLKTLIGVYLLLLVYALYRAMTEQFYATIGPHGHIVWNSQQGSFVTGEYPIIGILYLLGLFIGLFWALPQSWSLITIGVLTFVFAQSRANTGEFNSYWCFTAVAYSVAALMV